MVSTKPSFCPSPFGDHRRLPSLLSFGNPEKANFSKAAEQIPRAVSHLATQFSCSPPRPLCTPEHGKLAPFLYDSGSLNVSTLPLQLNFAGSNSKKKGSSMKARVVVLFPGKVGFARVFPVPHCLPPKSLQGCNSIPCRGNPCSGVFTLPPTQLKRCQL